MIKSNLCLICALTLASLSSIGLSAQTKIWGVGAPIGQAEGEFQNAFTQATGTPYSTTGWTALSVFENKSTTTPTVTPGAAYWTRSLLGYSQGFYAGTVPIASPSQANGSAIFDSGFMDNNGTANSGVGTSPAGHRGELISPRIDLTAYQNRPLVLQYYSRYRDRGNFTTELSVSMSTDDGATWGTPVDYRSLQTANNTSIIRILLPAVSGSNLTECRIRFVAETNYYYASIDDVTLETAPDYDIGFGKADPNNTTSIIASGDFVKIGGNRYYPLSNLDVNSLQEWFWGGKVVNEGALTLTPQDSARMYVTIDYFDPVTNVRTNNVYLDTMEIDSLTGGDLSGAPYIEYLRDINFLNTYGVGSYLVKYWVGHKHIDGAAENDTVRHIFTITGSSYLSKARRAAADRRVFADQSIFPQGNSFSAFEYGSVYYFPKGMTNNLKIDSIEFRYYVPSTYTGNATQTVFVNIAKLTDGSGSTAADGFIDGDELTSVGSGTVTIDNIATSSGTAAGSYGLAVATSLREPGGGGPMPPLTDNGFYYISVLQNQGALGGAATFSSNTALWMGADQYNYYMNRLMTRPDTVINSSPLMNTDPAGVVSWFADGINGGYVPSIGIHLPPFPLGTSTPLVAAETGAEMQVYPNPVTSDLNINVKYDNATDVQYILTDVSGRVLSILNSKNVTEETTTINVEKLPTGVYFVTARTEAYTTTKRFIKK